MHNYCNTVSLKDERGFLFILMVDYGYSRQLEVPNTLDLSSKWVSVYWMSTASSLIDTDTHIDNSARYDWE